MKPLITQVKQHPLKVLLFLLLLAATIYFFTRPAPIEIVDVVEQLPKHPNKSYSKRSLDKIDGIVVHHSASFGQDATKYANYHIESRGWPGIGYHFVLYPNGRIEQTNYLDTISYHTAGANSSKIGICLSGNFQQGQPTPEQLASLKKLISHLRQQLPQYLTVSGHRNHGSTSCPGQYLYPHLQQFQLA